MKQKETLFWLWLAEALGAANRDFRKLISLYDSPYEIFHLDDDEIERIDGISERTYRALCDKSLQRATEVLSDCEALGIRILPYRTPEYPYALYDLQAPPIVLYCLGEIPEDFDRKLSIGMVGTRKMSEYGLYSAYKIAYELASAGVVIVSGMAAGIDGVSAAAALAAGGKTIAILGCGLDEVYPRHHKKLRDEIARHGALLSEYPPKTRPNHYHFPIRNRLISGISQGTLVVEAGIGSGSLITAKDAILQGRDVFALPANVGSRGSEGTNGLLRDGANLVLDARDILNRYLYTHTPSLKMETLSKIGKRSRADLELLDRLGVIQLIRKKNAEEEKSPTAKAPAADPPRTPRKRRTATPAPGKEEPPPLPPPRPAEKSPDEVLSTLSDVQRAILEAMPDDRAVSAEALAGLGYPYHEISSAITMLEILGLVQKLPGALYTKT